MRPRTSVKSTEKYDEHRDSKSGSRKSSISSKNTSLKAAKQKKKGFKTNFSLNDIHRKKSKTTTAKRNAFSGGKNNQNANV